MDNYLVCAAACDKSFCAGYKFALDRIAERLKEMGFTEVDEFMEQFYDTID